MNREVSGPFTGTSTFDFATPPCSSSAALDVHQVFDGTYTVKSRRTGSFHLDGCTNISNLDAPFPFSGTFTLAAPNGATMNGTAAGTVTGTPTPAELDLSITLTPTGGTSKFANVGGVVNLTGTWHSSTVPGVPGPISGSLTGALTR